MYSPMILKRSPIVIRPKLIFVLLNSFTEKNMILINMMKEDIITILIFEYFR